MHAVTFGDKDELQLHILEISYNSRNEINERFKVRDGLCACPPVRIETY